MRKRMHKQKLKNERKTLQETVEDLTLHLEELKQGHQSTTRLEILDCTWRALAVKEREKQLTSESEQMHLLAAAEANASCIKELCKQLPIPGAECTHSAVKSDSGNTQPPTFLTSPPFDHAMFRGHLRRVYESYAQTGTALDFESMN
ncbi:hypothetical protein PHYPSEUDO_002076 [Phytophthora pseudosyringae]|uniref:Uncharacterized protein n=1 Tax=Phytophthora pseudosyringae TaxID=221518 RepID=A0A8T1VYG5_9STRA|nr:hypothetical protein PHYPSEUDO_002076 [Phytophthora pseudosyringae]